MCTMECVCDVCVLLFVSAWLVFGGVGCCCCFLVGGAGRKYIVCCEMSIETSFGRAGWINWHGIVLRVCTDCLFVGRCFVTLNCCGTNM